MKPLWVLAVAVFLSVTPAMRASAEGDGLQYYAPSDPQMEAAIAAALRHLPEFTTRASQSDLTTGAFLVKWARPLDEGGREHIWVTVTEIAGTQMSGFLANEPVHFTGHQGEPVTFAADEISDWAYWDEAGKMHGAYTTRVMLGQLSAEERQQLQAVLAPLPKEN